MQGLGQLLDKDNERKTQSLSKKDYNSLTKKQHLQELKIEMFSDTVVM